MQQGTFEPEETAIVSRLLAHADVFVNVGANVGYYCCIALQHGVRTIAVEPLSGNLRYLYQNIRANHWEDRIEIFPLAVSARTGLADIYGGGTGASLVRGWAGTSAHYVTVVPTTTLDSLLAGRAAGRRCLILADIEGAEHDMLTGAEATILLNPRPMWLVEIAVEHHQPAAVPVNPFFQTTFRRFWEAGYEAWTADRNLRLVTASDVAAIQSAGTNTLGTHNFLFIEAGHRADLLPTS